MAEKKQTTKKPVERKVVAAGTGKTATATATKAKTVKQAAPEKGGNATGLRVGAVVFWLLGIACEVFAILMLNGTFNFENPAKGTDPTMTYLIIALVVDLVLVIIGSQLWKKSNDIDPASEQNKIKFFLWNNMGLIASILAFFPIVILLLQNKELDAKTKKIATAVAAVALVLAAATSIDYNPTSAEQMAEAQATTAEAGIDTVYWTPYGRRYHLNVDCQSLQNSATLIEGNITQAFEANRNTPCAFCAADMGELVLEGEEADDAAILPAA